MILLSIMMMGSIYSTSDSLQQVLDRLEDVNDLTGIVEQIDDVIVNLSFNRATVKEMSPEEAIASLFTGDFMN